ncbi:glycosyltransferase [Vibrio mediterranei]
MSEISVLVSTYNPDAERIASLLESIRRAAITSSVEAIIVVQSSRTFRLDAFKGLMSTLIDSYTELSIKVSYIDSKGVTKSRNHAMELAESNILLFADDDITYLPNSIDKLVKLHHSYPDGFITTKVLTPELMDFKNYPSAPRQHSLKSILSCGTIEISFKDYKDRKASFPENLGAGTKFSNCDEPVFLSRLMGEDQKGLFVPLELCVHPHDSSGQNVFSYSALVSRLIAFQYIFGRIIGVFVFFIFCLKKIKEYCIR